MRFWENSFLVQRALVHMLELYSRKEKGKGNQQRDKSKVEIDLPVY
uniref:Uncharacterized protein n=1 Tax=Utricularia reniformis TaxID=192314 RepID=A0A1Y0B3C4_9LAMI|nr:hypothetical protein AEK19_MT1708 [Utricularia reniformis]ART31888.1 hypothetical protein AEK19_MT1708 [Utricularia reniformis]